MNITDAQLYDIVFDIANIGRAEDGEPPLSPDEVAAMKAEAMEDPRQAAETRRMIVGMVESVVKHLGLRPPRDERLVEAPFYPTSRHSNPPVALPNWVFQQADEITNYMAGRGIINWKLSGIQARVD